MAKATKKDSKTFAEKATSRSAVASQKKKKGSVKEYFKGVSLEMKKVVWPTKRELGSYTAVVICACLVFAAAFWIIDMGVLAALKGVLGITM